MAEAGTVQPFAYFQLVFVAIIALTLFDERPDAWTVAGAALILAAGLYTVLREARLARARRPAADRGDRLDAGRLGGRRRRGRGSRRGPRRRADVGDEADRHRHAVEPRAVDVQRPRAPASRSCGSR